MKQIYHLGMLVGIVTSHSIMFAKKSELAAV
jgi:hypothetical protein